MSLFIRLLTCIIFAGFVLYKYVDQLNQITELRLSIPILTKEVKEIEEKNLQLQYQIDSFESPVHLMELSRRPEMGYLKYPLAKDVICVPQINSLECSYDADK